MWIYFSARWTESSTVPERQPGFGGRLKYAGDGPLPGPVAGLAPRPKIPDFQDIHRDPIQLCRDQLVRGEFDRRDLLLHHHDQGYLSRRLTSPHPQSDPHPDDVGQAEQVGLVGILRLLSLGGDFLPDRSRLVSDHRSTSRQSRTSRIGLKMVACSEPAKSRPTARNEPAPTTTK